MQDKTAIETLFNQHVISGISYVDTLIVRLPRLLRSDQLRAIRARCGSFCYEKSDKPIWMKHKKWRLYQAKIYLHQPTVEVIHSIDRWFKTIPPTIVGLHIAFDLITASPAAAHQINACITQHLYKPWHRLNHKISHYSGHNATTTYFRERNSPTVLVIYSDKKSKILDTPCCHFEIRLSSRNAVPTSGIKNLRNIIALDPKLLLNRWFRMCVLDKEKLGKISSGRHANSKSRISVLWYNQSRNYDIWSTNTKIRIARYRYLNSDYGDYQPQLTSDVLALSTMGVKGVKTCLITINTNRFLPDALSWPQKGIDDG